ncbi:MAG TPA: Rv3235 family protein [Propionibacteriaceae bacterium]|nr:Rv3235 family protein [Propionibacteriaceae bacterium]
MTATPDDPTPLPLPRPIVLDGRRLLLCRPDPPPLAAPPGTQPPLPLDGPALDDARLGDSDLEPARAWVAMLGRVILEVLTGRRPAAQLGAHLDDRSVAYLAAWANRATLRPRAVGTPHLRRVTPSRIEGWVPFHTPDHEFVAVLCLRHDGVRWSCRDLRVLAPAGGAAA